MSLVFARYLARLLSTIVYNIIELSNGIQWNDPQNESVPWVARGALPPNNEMQALNPEEQRSEGYGNKLLDNF